MIQAKEMTGEQWARFRSALHAAHLPADDIELPGRTFFEFTQEGETVGRGGSEAHGTEGLLRSLVVEPNHRSKGVGVAVLQFIEAAAAAQGIARLHLLTTTAAGFFEQQGYDLHPRGSEPVPIAQTSSSEGFARARRVTCAKRSLQKNHLIFLLKQRKEGLAFHVADPVSRVTRGLPCLQQRRLHTR